MATGIEQKSCTALFPLWFLKKNDISKMKKKRYKEKIQKALKGILIFKYRKNKSKNYTCPDYALALKFPL